MTDTTRRALLGAGMLLPLAGSALAQDAPKPAEETWDQRWQRLLREDWPMLSHYADENARYLATGARTNIVFMGDSITEGWAQKRPGFFKPGRLGRGIGGQTTPQMVLRMMQDVVQFKPKYVHIMAATNDIAGNTGRITIPQTIDNYRAMIAIAKANGIRVIMAAVPPADHFPWRPGLEVVRPIREINAWIAANAKPMGYTFVDYGPVLADASLAMKPGMASDGVHPTEQGYDAMATVIEPVLRRFAV